MPLPQTSKQRQIEVEGIMFSFNSLGFQKLIMTSWDVCYPSVLTPHEECEINEPLKYSLRDFLSINVQWLTVIPCIVQMEQYQKGKQFVIAVSLSGEDSHPDTIISTHSVPAVFKAEDIEGSLDGFSILMRR